ncbi:MAG TPA: ABC transporter permease [Lachnospiraceae bacterium]|nr:ABC transporter permease [Lachnospiraceae bacterium]
MRNNNSRAIHRLSLRTLKNNRLRNIFAICAITLTAMLFTAVFSLLSGIMQASQESTMHEIGTRYHAGLKNADTKQYEKTSADPLVKKCSYDIFIGIAKNITKRQSEIRVLPFEDALQDYFITLQEGKMPEAEDEIVVDTYIMDELKIPFVIGEKIPLVFQFMGKTFEKEFKISGYYNGDAVSHASQVFVSERFWLELKGGHTEADFRAWGKKHPDDNGTGLLSVHFYFDNASNLEEKVRTVISNAGYEPGTELDYGVNWAYMANRMESADPFSICVTFGALAVILLTGYLIIYNIFQISIMNDIRFYGLLKTTGTTKKQLHRLIIYQVLMLSVIGIPLGLLLGYAVGNLGMPMLSRLTNQNSNLSVSLQPDPFIFLSGAAFSVVTVFLSCHKPGKIAGSVSPVEAVKYTEATVKGHKKRHKQRHFSILSMALANLSRNKKKTCVVTAAISLGMILLTLVMTGTGSFQLSQFLEERVAGDIMIMGNRSIGNTDYAVDEKYIQFAESQQGIEEINEMWICTGKNIVVDEKGKASLKKLKQEGKLNFSYGINPLEQDTFIGDFFGYTDGLFKNIKVLEGSIDVDKFQNGNYILLNRFYGDSLLEASDSPYHPGDKVTVSSITKNSKEYEVMAIVEYPHSMDLSRFTPNGMNVVLPLKEFKKPSAVNSACFAKSYKVKDENKEAFEAAVKDYTESTSPDMQYTSKQTLANEFSGLVTIISTIGFALAIVIAFISILNFINAVFTGIISRKREFAMLQSIGMTTGQLQGVIICEGISYVAAAGLINLFIGSALSYLVLGALNNIITFFEYKFQILPLLIMLPVLLAVAIATPAISFWHLQKESVVERLREAE